MKIAAIVLGIVIVVLLGLLIFIPAAKEPVVTKASFEVDLPQANAVVSSPVAIEGSVTGGGWFFEASLPIKVLDGDGAVLGQGTAQALSDWTLTGTVPFSASIAFTAPHFATGTIVFANDNPSGLAANQKSFSVPIEFEGDAVGSNGSGNGSGQGIRGTVLLGPTCPVEKNPPDPQCADKPYTAKLVLTTTAGANIEAFQSDASGTFSVEIPAGEYDIASFPSGAMLPRCTSNGTITVKAGAYTQVQVFCDTGIR